jgi:4a-hydroxytetrahydrobiopterin dehydratase
VPRLDDAAIERMLGDLPDWRREGDEIVRTARLDSFQAVIQLVGRIADLAEAADHHPDIDIRYRNLRLALTTHDEGGLTEKDFDLARQIELAIAGSA